MLATFIISINFIFLIFQKNYENLVQSNILKIKQVSTEKGQELEEITNKLTTVRESQQRVQRRLEDTEQRPAGAMNAAVVNKEATFCLLYTSRCV